MLHAPLPRIGRLGRRDALGYVTIEPQTDTTRLIGSGEEDVARKAVVMHLDEVHASLLRGPHHRSRLGLGAHMHRSGPRIVAAVHLGARGHDRGPEQTARGNIALPPAYERD